MKISKEKIEGHHLDMFGEWFKLDSLPEVASNPFDHVIIPNFLDHMYYSKLQNVLPKKPTNEWWKYENPLEVKYALDNLQLMDPMVENIFYALSHEKIITKMQHIFNITNLEYDPYCHGAGLHMHPRNGRLNMHLDYEKHPITNKQRRLNVILYLNDDWQNEWNGDTQLWNNDMTKCMVKSYPKSNTAIIFVTTDQSWHGLPEIISCPEDMFRRTLAFYYVSEFPNCANMDQCRTKAVFVKRPNDPEDKRMEELFKIRSHRLITKNDLDQIWPGWTCF